MANIKSLLVGGALIVVVALALYFYGYSEGRGSMMAKWSALTAKVEMTNRQAEQRLVKLRADRDRKAAELKRRAEEREKLDDEAQAEIDRLATRLEQRPVRVRVVTEPRACGGGSESDSAANTGSGEKDPGQASGVLPEKNSQRLREALREVEGLSAAYNSCRSYLMTLRAAPP